MEKLSKKKDSSFGTADSVEAEVVRAGKVLTGDWSDSMSENIGVSDSVTAEVNS